MPKHWIIVGTLLYFVLVGIFIPFFSDPPIDSLFQSDAYDYSQAAINLLHKGMYSVDGVTPFLEREPAMSVFLATIYAVFGIENVLAVIITQIVVFFIASYVFAVECGSRYTPRVAGLCFVLLLTSGSILHSVFLAYRELFGISLGLFAAAFFLRGLHKQSLLFWIFSGLLCGVLILTFFPFFFLPALISSFFVMSRRHRLGIVLFVLAVYSPVFLWALRNHAIDGHLRVIANQRTAVMWYVRGEQAERVRGLEPLRCLWSEYVSRDWTNRSDACSFNGLMHGRWPDGFDRSKDYSDIAVAGQQKIFDHLLSYLTFSLFDIIELHIPFVGGGFNSTFNMYTALTGFILYLGFLLGIPAVLRSKEWLWLLPIVYTTLVYALTDATPRYLVPCLFVYVIIAAIGYDRLLSRISRSS